MSFDVEYQRIKDFVIDDLDLLENGIKAVFDAESPINKCLLELLLAPAKRLRPMLALLFLRCALGEINEKQRELLVAVELIHNATLIHDDIIDESDTRREKETLNAKFDNNLAVIAGDFLLSTALEKIINTDSVQVIKICTSALKMTCLGEITQYFSKFNIPTMDEYIEKSKEKTALLFEIGILGGLLLSDAPVDENLYNCAKEFVENFGIAFQIRDDLRNIKYSSKLGSDDINCGVYTAPIIYAQQENENILDSENILAAIKETTALEKTKNLMDNYYYKSISAIDNLENNKYKAIMLELISLLKEDL